MVIYGLCGFIGSGKDAACQALVDAAGATKFSFAGALKDVVSTLFSWDRDMLDGITPESRKWREEIDAHWSTALDRTVTPRFILQHMGTDVFRQFHKEIWIKVAERKLLTSPAKVAVFTDCRFGNEIDFISNQNGILFWVYRPDTNNLTKSLLHQVDGFKRLTLEAASSLGVLSSLHPSETSFLTEGANKLNIVVINNGTLDDLTSCMAHAHDVCTSNALAAGVLPFRFTTVYLDKFLGNNFRWRYNSERGDELQTLFLPDFKNYAQSLAL